MDKAEINVGGGGGGIPGAGQGTIPTAGGPRGTLLYDAVYLATHDKLQQETGRKAIIILSDGEDQGSMEKLQGAIEAAQKSNTIVYVLLCADRGFYGRGMYTMGYTGDMAMKKMAEETGGRVIEVGNNGKKLDGAFAQIEEELPPSMSPATRQPTPSSTGVTVRLTSTSREMALRRCRARATMPSRLQIDAIQS